MNANENHLPIEVLQPEINGQIVQTTIEELKTWISHGKLQPAHQVRLKNLSWIEAQKIPALQILFQEKLKESEEKSKVFHNQPVSTVSKRINPRIDTASAYAKKTSVSKNNASLKNTQADAEFKCESATSPNSKPKTSEPSVPFKIIEKRALTKSREFQPKANSVRVLRKPAKTKSLIKKTLGFLAGCVLMFLLSLGGSYLWVYQLKTPIEIDEKSLVELTNLEDKLISDKLALRLKTAAEEKSKVADNRASHSPQSNVTQEIAKLENQHSIERKTIVENHRSNLANLDFNVTFSFSSAVLLILFLLTRILYGKTSQPSQNQRSSKPFELPNVDLLKPSAAVVESADFENAQITDAKKSAEVRDENSSKQCPTESSSEAEDINKILPASKESSATETLKSMDCLLHQDKASEFVCNACTKYFCAECAEAFGEEENCCPLCKIACKPVDEKSKILSAAQSKTESENKLNLPDIDKKTISNFTVYDYPDEKTRKIGIIPAFVIALLFSASISIFWVYKISPALENRETELSQNIPPNETTAAPLQQTAHKKTDAAGEQQSANKTGAGDSGCIDPQTRQPFECDEETRKALYEHTRKVQSVEKAQQQTSEKTNTILSLIMPSASPQSGDLKPNAVEEAQKESDKQQLIKVFVGSFIIIFGLIMSTRLFSSGK